MRERLAGARVLVTGAARGLGRAVTLDLVERGATVAALDIDEGALKAVARDTHEVVPITCDVADADAVDAAFDRALQELGGLDGVVSNAAIVGVTRAPAHEITPPEFDRVMAVNARGCWLVLRRAVPVLRAGGGGSVVTMTSQTVLTGSRHLSHYVASKAAVLGMTRAFAREAGPDVRVNAVAPGFTDTPGARAIGDPATYDITTTPLGRVGQPRDVTGAVAFLLSGDSAFMTGQVLVVDGGRTTH